MAKKLIHSVIAVLIVINIVLLISIFGPQLKQIKRQIEESDALPVGSFVPTFHDYYFDYVHVNSFQLGDWLIEAYQEVKRLVDENGMKIKDIPTGNIEYVRYYVGDNPGEVLIDLMEEEEHAHLEIETLHQEGGVFD